MPETAARGESRLGTEPIGRLLVTMSVPMMVSFFIQALYNIVDSMFVARISENALTAVSLAFPMQQIVNAIAVGLGVGINACVPRHLARGDRDGAERAAGCAVFLGVACAALFAVLGLTSVHAIYTVQTDVAEIVTLGTSYLRICWTLCLGVFLGQVFEKLLVSTGNAVLAMAAQASGAVINIIFDPLLIFGIGPFPTLGIAGAASATVAGQLFAAALALALNLRRSRVLDLRIRRIRPNAVCLRDILSVGFPSMITMGLSSVTTFSINQILLTYSTTATAVYGIWLKLLNFCHMPIFGMNNGTVPILSYNLARGKLSRVRKTIRLACLFAAAYLLILAAVLECIPNALLSLFSASDNMRAIGVTALRICILSLPIGGVAVIFSSAMQAMRHASYALIVNLLRQFFLLIALFALLSAVTGSLTLTWFAVPLTDTVGLLVASLLLARMMRTLGAESAG